jgi:subtilisin family serine protease
MQAGWTMKLAGTPAETDFTIGARDPQDDRGRGIAVAVIDGGFGTSVMTRHDGWLDGAHGPDGGDQTLDVDGNGVLDEGAGHGTFVAGVVRQVAPGCDLGLYRALDSFGFGSTWKLKDAIMAAFDDGCRVINLSLGYDDVDYLGSPAISACLHYLPTSVAVVAAAGNSGSRVPILPGSHVKAIAVGALDTEGKPCAWSNRGPWVDFSCVGEGIVSTFVPGVAADRDDRPAAAFAEPDPVAMWMGTSFAAPQVSGGSAVARAEGKSVRGAVERLRADYAPPSADGQGHPARVPHPDFGYLLKIL